ncbi:MAG: hypothetical protein KGI25_00195 [Thaumarchaeota archaeon]|nr:hypothetical protein [Nitrososphaerota archaeon]
MQSAIKIILIVVTISLITIFSVSYVHAQTLSFGASNQTTISNSTLTFGGFSNSTTQVSPTGTGNFVIPYHPRNATAYYAEKQQLDNATRNWLKTHQSPIIPDPSGVNIYPGLNNELDAASSGGFDPPDVQVAVGPNHIMELVNVKGEIWNKAGVSLQNVTLGSFFGFTSSTSSSGLGDPKILYDSQSGRWFATLENFTNGTVSIKVSQTNDPTGSWYPPIHDSSFTGCPDQPKIGVSDDKFVVSVNDFPAPCPLSGSSTGAEFHVFDKTKLIIGTKNVQIFPVQTSDFGITPVQSQSSTSPLYMVSDGGVSTTQIKLYNLTGQVPNVVIKGGTPSVLNVRTINLAPSAVQPITTTLLDTGDERILDAAWNKGKLWFSLNDGCTPNGDTIKRACVRLIQLNTNTTIVTQDFDINASATYYYYPALRLDGFGGMGTIFGTSSTATYPSLLVTAQAASDPVKSYKPLSYIQTGSNYEDVLDGCFSGSTFTCARYGDYFGAALDPSDNSRVWVGGEYNKLAPGHTFATWSTFIGSISFDCLPHPTGDWTITTSCTLAGNATPPANVIVQNNALLTIPSGVNLNLDFAHYHLLVNSGSGVYIATGGKIS